MTVSALTTSPTYPVAGTPTTLAGTSDTYYDDAIEWSLDAVPSASRLALGRVVANHPGIPRTGSVALVFHAEDTVTGQPARISRSAGSFVANGFTVGARVAISGTASNDKQVTIAAVSPLSLTLDAADTLTAESITAALSGVYAPVGAASNVLTFDVPGEYTLTAYEWFVFDGLGAYSGDPLGAGRRELKSTASFTVHVGAALDLPIAPVNGHGSTLRIVVVSDTVRAAELVSPATELARVAALDATVSASVAALVGIAVNSLDVDFVTDVDDLATLAAAHWLMTHPVHVSADTSTVMLREPSYSVPAAIVRLNDLVAKHLAHQEATSAGGTWHGGRDDTKNTLQVPTSAANLTEAIVLKADFRERVYRRHLNQTASPASHGGVDGTNIPSTPVKKLPAAIRDYLDFVALGSASVPAGESEGIGDAQAAWGFRLTA